MLKKQWDKILYLKGYVTQWSALKGFDVPTLEARLGFNRGALAHGYAVYGLAAIVEMDDFIWRDQTHYSGGWHPDRSIELPGEKGKIWSVQRSDELRFELYRQHGYDEQQADAAMERLKQKWLVEMNSCFGDRQIVKVISNAPPQAWPDSPFRGVKQWEIRADRAKRFRLLHAGGAGAA